MFGITKLKKIPLKDWTENEVSGCASTKFLATAQIESDTVLITMYERGENGYEKSPYMVVCCEKEEFQVWLIKEDKITRSAVFNSYETDWMFVRGCQCWGSSPAYAAVTFASAEDKQIVMDFLKNQKQRPYDWVSAEKVNSLPSPWKEFIWYQIDVLGFRLKKRHLKRDQKRECLFSYLKEPSEGFKNWVWKKVFQDTQHLYYTPQAANKVKVECSVCHGHTTLKRMDIPNFGRKKEGKCPICGAKGTFLPRNVQPDLKNIERRVGIMQKTPEGFVYRVFMAERVYKKDTLPEAKDTLTEFSRMFISGRGETGYMVMSDRWVEKKDGWYYSDFLYPATVKGAIADTKYRNCGIDMLAKPCVSMCHQRYFYAVDIHPVLEKVTKAGFLSVMKDYLGDYNGYSLLNSKATDLYGALKLPRSEVRRILRMKCQNNSQVIWTLQQAYQKKVTIRDEEITEIIETEMRMNMLEDLFTCMKEVGVTAHKLIKYLTDQAKKHYKSTDYRTAFDRALSEFRDMLIALTELGKNTKDLGLTMQANLRKAHDDAVEENNTRKDREKREEEERENREYAKKMAVIRKQVEKNYSDALHLRSDKLMVVGLWTPEALIAEGDALHNCIKSYRERVAEGQTMILAVRKISQPDKPYCAFEYKDDRIIQLEADRHAKAPEDVKAFVDIFHEMYQKEKKKMKKAAAMAA